VQGGGWKKGDRIGTGSYGCVFKALHKDSGLIFAVKCAVLDENNEEDCKFRARLEEELDICKRLRHPNIISFLGTDYEDNNLYIYLEFAAGGSLASVLHEFGPLGERLLQPATRGLLEGLNYLHTQDPPVVHRDIKGANILVDLKFTVKLADFGCSKRNTVTTSFTMIGSVPWMAPEVILQQDGHGRKADIWSVGCTIIEMATAEKPWGDNMFDNLMFALSHIGLSTKIPTIPEAVSGDCHDLITRCLRRSAQDRPSTEDLLADCAAARWWLEKLEDWQRAMPFVSFMAPDNKTAREHAPRKKEEVLVPADIPAYPTSNKQKRDWSKIDQDMENELKNEKPEGDQALNTLFKQIYDRADDETRRAMNKSFQTSGGTVLSTNWGEVGKADYEGKDRPTPPEGQEWRDTRDKMGKEHVPDHVQ